MLQHSPVQQTRLPLKLRSFFILLVLPATADRLSAGNSDTNLTFFTDVLGYSDDEIQREIENAL